MVLKDFIGKVVIHGQTKKPYVLREIASSYIDVASETPDEHGHIVSYRYRTVNGDPISTGALVFQDPALTEPFRKAYAAYCQSRDGYWEDYGYWMRMD